jgi:FtsZ-interacting cell division protein ZipA
MSHDVLIGAGLLVVGLVIVFALLIVAWTQPRSRVSGFDAASIEQLTMPTHERLAKKLAHLHGCPEFMWRRFTPLAVSMILLKEDHAS